MIEFCLTYDEIKELPLYFDQGVISDYPGFAEKMVQANSWESKVVIFTYFFSWFLDGYQTDNLKKGSYIANLYELVNTSFFEIEECNINFIKYLIHFSRNNEESLDQALFNILMDYINHKYDQSFRS